MEQRLKHWPANLEVRGSCIGSALERAPEKGMMPGTRQRGRPERRWADDVEDRPGLQMSAAIRKTQSREKGNAGCHLKFSNWRMDEEEKEKMMTMMVLMMIVIMMMKRRRRYYDISTDYNFTEPYPTRLWAKWIGGSTFISVALNAKKCCPSSVRRWLRKFCDLLLRLAKVLGFRWSKCFGRIRRKMTEGRN